MYQGYIACDPGAKGSIALVIPELSICTFKDTTETPINIYNWILANKIEYDIQSIWVEQVRNIMGVSSSSNFKFGYNFGHLVGILSVTNIPINFVQPKEWQKNLGVTIKGNKPSDKRDRKQEIGELVQRIFPYADIHGSRGGLHDGKSDALGILFYGLTKGNNNADNNDNE